MAPITIQSAFIVGAILLVPAIVIAFFGARTWHWGHVLTVVGIYASLIWFFFLARETLRINDVYRSAIDRKTKQLEQLTADNDALRNGTDDSNVIARLRNEAEPAVIIPENAESIPSLADLDHEILLATRLRGRVWEGAAPAGVDATGTVRLAAAPAGLKKDTVVFVFEEGPAQLPAADGTPQGKQFLGEFRVNEPAAGQVTLAPVQPLDQFEQRRLSASRGPWVIYETMPPDRYELFAGMTEDQLRQRIPPQSVDEYFRHGKEAKPDDDDARKQGVDADGKLLPPGELANAAKTIYQRRLRDYAAEFDELARRRVDMDVSKAAAQKDIDRLTAALASAKQTQAYRENEVKRLTTDRDGVKKERQAIESHLAQVRQQVAKVRELLDSTLKQNSELADRLAEIQLGAPALGAPLLQPEP
jgi:hypothetical protein